MFFKRFYDEQLAQASYLVGCQESGTAIVIDPARVIAPYLETAIQEGLSITGVTETHIHADFVSGLREIAAATGARMYLSGCGTPDWQYRFKDDPTVTVLTDRATITVGNIVLTAVHTPGHTPEHLCFLIADGKVTTEPMGVVTGDFVFVGDVGRPDLLEKAAHVANTARAGAAQLFRSLAWFKTLPDHLQVWPGHGAGSACGKGLGAMPQSTVGYEKRFNWAFGPTDEGQFIDQVLAGQPDPPRYFGRMKRVNRDGPRILGKLPEPKSLSASEVEDLIRAGAVVIDSRAASAYVAGHLPGTISIPMNRSFTTYAGSVVPYDQPLNVILADTSPAAVAALVQDLVSIGFDEIAGVADSAALFSSGTVASLSSLAEITPQEWLSRRLEGAIVIDVRNHSEWDAGHLANAKLIPLPELVDRLAEIPQDTTVIVHCQTGARSVIAASILEAKGWSKVIGLRGGFAAWTAVGGQSSR